MGATFSSGAEVEAPPAAAAGGDDKKLWNDDLVDGYVFVDDAAEVDVPRAAAPGGEEKTMWPELVGKNEFDAAHAILEDRHDVRVHYYDYGRKAPPPGFDPKRVVLFIDSTFRVVNVPKVCRMGATFSSSGAEVEVPPAAAAGCDDKKLWNDDLVDSYVFVVDTAEVDVSQAAAANGDDVKTLWPELVGRHVIDAAREIVEDRPEVRVYFYDYCKNAPPPGFDPKRVVLFRDSENLVVTVPKLG